ncbi:unnamed protein product [Merluccius merluccius]
MEARQQWHGRGRGGSWRRGGGGHDSDSAGGEARGRGRGGGGHRGGRGKRDHYRGRGRGNPAGAGAGGGFFQQRNQNEARDWEEEEEEQEEVQVFSRRKLGSNWDRYLESEREEAAADDSPAVRGTDYHVLLESAGDSFTQFRFSEEKDWEMDSVASSQMSAVRLDLVALAQCLQALPLHQRLNLEAELVQVSTPLELPAATIPPKQDPVLLTPPIPTTKDTSPRLSLAGSPLVATPPQVAPALANLSPVDDADEELDRLLGLDKPGPDATLSQPADTYVVPQEALLVLISPVAPEEVPERVEPALPTRTEPAKQEVTEEDLEDWLDSMIS